MANVCAVRTMKDAAVNTLRDGLHADVWLSHEPKVFTEEMKSASIAALRERGIFDHMDLRFQSVGTPLLRNGDPICSHCGCLYSESE